jgi:hypothetical protein
VTAREGLDRDVLVYYCFHTVLREKDPPVRRTRH